MQTELVFTFIAHHKVGILDHFAKLVAENQGNWLASKMVKLAGQFTGIVQISVHETHAEMLKEALEALQTPEMSIIVELHPLKNSTQIEQYNRQQFSLHFLGLDRVGIVKEVSQALVNHHVNVIEFESFTEAAPMAGSLMFKAQAVVDCDSNQSIEQLEAELEAIANELDLDYVLDQK